MTVSTDWYFWPGVIAILIGVALLLFLVFYKSFRKAWDSFSIAGFSYAASTSPLSYTLSLGIAQLQSEYAAVSGTLAQATMANTTVGSTSGFAVRGIITIRP
jgi:hypothetical protein